VQISDLQAGKLNYAENLTTTWSAYLQAHEFLPPPDLVRGLSLSVCLDSTATLAAGTSSVILDFVTDTCCLTWREREKENLKIDVK